MYGASNAVQPVTVPRFVLNNGRCNRILQTPNILGQYDASFVIIEICVSKMESFRRM